jgi:hypothetical protein
MKTAMRFLVVAMTIALSFTFFACSDDDKGGGAGSNPKIPSFVPSTAPANATELATLWESDEEFTNISKNDEYNEVHAIRTVGNKIYSVSATKSADDVEYLREEIAYIKSMIDKEGIPAGMTNANINDNGYSYTACGGYDIFSIIVGGEWVFEQYPYDEDECED